AADHAVEAGIAAHAVDPIVEAPAQVARPGVGVAGVPAGEKNLALVANVVAFGGAKKQRVRGLHHDDAVLVEREARRNAELVGKDGEFVGHAVAVGVFADDDAIATLAVAPT